jgi:hypothetical protein
MDEREYRRICSQPDVMRRSDLRATLHRLQGVRPDLTHELHALLRASPVPKPAHHDGGRDTEFLWLDLAPEVIQEIVDELAALEASLVAEGQGSGRLEAAATLLDRWNAAESSRPGI